MKVVLMKSQSMFFFSANFASHWNKITPIRSQIYAFDEEIQQDKTIKCLVKHRPL